MAVHHPVDEVRWPSGRPTTRWRRPRGAERRRGLRHRRLSRASSGHLPPGQTPWYWGVLSPPPGLAWVRVSPGPCPVGHRDVMPVAVGGFARPLHHPIMPSSWCSPPPWPPAAAALQATGRPVPGRRPAAPARESAVTMPGGSPRVGGQLPRPPSWLLRGRRLEVTASTSTSSTSATATRAPRRGSCPDAIANLAAIRDADQCEAGRRGRLGHQRHRGPHWRGAPRWAAAPGHHLQRLRLRRGTTTFPMYVETDETPPCLGVRRDQAKAKRVGGRGRPHRRPYRLAGGRPGPTPSRSCCACRRPDRIDGVRRRPGSAAPPSPRRTSPRSRCACRRAAPAGTT